MKYPSAAAAAAAALLLVTGCAGGSLSVEETCSRLNDIELASAAEAGSNEAREVGRQLVALAGEGHPDLADDLRSVGGLMDQPPEALETVDEADGNEFLMAFGRLAEACTE